MVPHDVDRRRYGTSIGLLAEDYRFLYTSSGLLLEVSSSSVMWIVEV